MAEYSEFMPVQRLRPRLSLSADATTVAYASDASGQFNVWTQPVAGGPARQLTFFTDQSVRELAWAPDGSAVAFAADTHGDEKYQIFLVPAPGGTPVQLSAARDRQHWLAEEEPFDPAGRYLLCKGIDQDLAVPDVIAYHLPGGGITRLPGVPGRTTFASGISPDGHHVLAAAFATNSEYECYLGDLDAPGPLQQLTGELDGAFHYPGPWDPDGSGFYLRTTAADGEHRSLASMSLPARTLTIIDAPAWDVEGVAVSGDGRTIAWHLNQNGASVLRIRRDGQPARVPDLPPGVIQDLDLSFDGTTAAMLLETTTRPMEVVVLTLGDAPGLRYLTDTRPPATSSGYGTTELIHYPSGDGTLIPGLLHRPDETGRHPVVLRIHGGPEYQARPWYEPFNQYLLAHGIGVLEPNPRGSTGYGIAWQQRIYKDWGGIDLDDFAAAATYLQSLDWTAPGHLAVMGSSYGGFAALSCMSRLPHLWAAGVSVCGPANLETLARSMPPSWASVVATMFGDPDTDADELRARSPVTYAHQITAPLLVIQGANDPRVPKAEADQIVEAARSNGADVTYLVFDDEGHGFTSRANHTKAHTTIAQFLTKHLLQTIDTDTARGSN
jgi:dipeptidyl aminopeptidase/acylaminoacyl peptidase